MKRLGVVAAALVVVAGGALLFRARRHRMLALDEAGRPEVISLRGDGWQLPPGGPIPDGGCPAPESAPAPPDAAAPARFAVIGDFGYAGPDEEAVADLVKAARPDFVLTTGDNNYQQGACSGGDQFADCNGNDAVAGAKHVYDASDTEGIRKYAYDVRQVVAVQRGENASQNADRHGECGGGADQQDRFSGVAGKLCRDFEDQRKDGGQPDAEQQDEPTDL